MDDPVELRIVWSEAAISDLRKICDYIASDAPKAALTVGRGILDRIKMLSSHPQTGHPYPLGSHGPVRQVLFRSYRIFYEYREGANTIIILHIRHGAREEPTF